MRKTLFRNHRGITARVLIVSGVITLVLGAAFVLLIVVLVVRPTGLLGETVAARAKV